MPERVIYLHPQAPAMPPIGQPCNGCGVCCALEPCPLGVMTSRRRTGRCTALQWNDEQLRHVCGWVASPQRFTGLGSRLLNRWVATLAARWIAAGHGCDAALWAEPPDSPASG
jgi:hypothetical protein